MKDPLDWEDLKVFAQLARDATVRGAAQSLGVHHATVSRRVDALEEALDLKLFLRTPDGYFLTDPGKTLFEEIDGFTDRLGDVRRRIKGTDMRVEGLLRVTMTVPIYTLTFAPRMAEFAEAYPDLEVELVTGVDFLDITRRRADVAIRMDNDPPPSLVGKRLFSYAHTVYCSPDYATKTGFEETPEAARWLRWRQTEAEFPEWSQREPFASMPRWGAFDDVSALQVAARHGQGVTLLPCLMGDADPGLVRASDAAPTPGREIWLLTHADLRGAAKVRAFMDFAERVLRDAKPEILGTA